MFSAYLVRKVKPSTVIDEIKAKSATKQPSEYKDKLKKMFNKYSIRINEHPTPNSPSNEFKISSMKMTLQCPLDLRIIQTPIRYWS